MSAALLTVAEVAAKLNISQSGVRRLVRESRIPWLRVGSAVRFDPAKVNEWLEGRSQDAVT